MCGYCTVHHSALNNIQIPKTFEDALSNINGSMPTLDQLKQKVNDVIETPFEQLRTEINDSGFSFLFLILLCCPSPSLILINGQRYRTSISTRRPCRFPSSGR